MRKEIISALILKMIVFMLLAGQVTRLSIGLEFNIWIFISFFVIFVMADLRANIMLIKLIAKDDTIRNNQKIVKIFKSTIWMLNITTLFWVFLIKKEKNNENNKTESSNNFNDQSKES